MVADQRRRRRSRRTSVGNVHIERLGNDRWLSTTLTPEQLWPQLRSFWKDSGFVLVQDRPDAGVMETDWAENRAQAAAGHHPQDDRQGVRRASIRPASSTSSAPASNARRPAATSTSRTAAWSRSTPASARTRTTWQPRPADPQLEAEFLSRLMVKLGATEEVAKAAVATTAAPARRRMRASSMAEPAATLQVDDGFDRAWRRVGVALDRSGFTVEDRDRAQGLYFVRYVDPKFAGKEEPGFFSKLFSCGKKDDSGGPARYRVAVKGEGDVAARCRC